MDKKWDAIIVGGGFYGLRIAQFLREELGFKNILVIEKEKSVMSRASYNNQARVHNGYHYPRSVLTALRSRVNLPVFTEEYKDAIVDDFEKFYGVASSLSKVSAPQFERFFQRIGADIEKAPKAMEFFNPKLIEEVFKVKEFAFNTTSIKENILSKLSIMDIRINTSEQALSVSNNESGIALVTDKTSYKTNYLINTTYSSINSLNRNSGLPYIPLKHELTEMCLVNVPEVIKDKAFTIMCGPFFSLMPFPAKNSFTLSHVRYTPHSTWTDKGVEWQQAEKSLNAPNKSSHFAKMIADVKRYMPLSDKIDYTGESLWEVKTVLPKSEDDDSRPILYRDHYGGIKNYICIMGGKIDNIYDVFRELKVTYEKSS